MKKRYTLRQLLYSVADELSIRVDHLETVAGSGRRATECRYILFLMMEKDGYTHKEIAEYFKISRETVTRGLATLEDWKRLYSEIKGNCERCERKLLS